MSDALDSLVLDDPRPEGCTVLWDCPSCRGDGGLEEMRCERCGGDGAIRLTDAEALRLAEMYEEDAGVLSGEWRTRVLGWAARLRAQVVADVDRDSRRDVCRQMFDLVAARA